MGTHAAAVTKLCLSASGFRLVSGASDGSIKLWDLDILTEVAYSSEYSSCVRSIAASGKEIIIGYCTLYVDVILITPLLFFPTLEVI